MTDLAAYFTRTYPRLQQAGLFLPRNNPTFRNPSFEKADGKILIVRLSPFRDVEASLPHHFLFQEARRAFPKGYVDLSFFPPAGDRERFDRDGIPYLFGLQSLRSASAFEIVLISKSCLLELINLPLLLLRSDLPLWSRERNDRHPLILLGGSNASATRTIVVEGGESFCDGIFFGEGEEQTGALLKSLKESRGKDRRRRLQEAAARVPGFWAAGGFPEKPLGKAIVSSPESAHPILDYPVINGEEADTARLPISRGCPSFCSFCFEGYDRRPYREIPGDQVLAAARALKRASGARTLEAMSFTFNAHRDIFDLLLGLNAVFSQVGFKSQRPDLLCGRPGLIEAEVLAGKRSFTLGIEGVSERLRAFLRKSLSLAAIEKVLRELWKQPIREIKLFYLLTGHEREEDLKEFREFLADLAETRRRLNPGTRVIFSFGYLVRMPGTPLRHDRLFLEPGEWKGIVGEVFAACAAFGWEARLAMEWEEYCVSQVLALGDGRLSEVLVEFSRRGWCYDGVVSKGYWPALRRWLETKRMWNGVFLGEKGPDYFPPSFLPFSRLAGGFLYREYLRSRSGTDGGNCLGGEKPGNCVDCGACDGDNRARITAPRDYASPGSGYFVRLVSLMKEKARIKPLFFRAHLGREFAGLAPAAVSAGLLRAIFSSRPDLAETILAASEALFLVGDNAGRFSGVWGETVIAIRALAPEKAAGLSGDFGAGGFSLRVDAPIEDFIPGNFRRALPGRRGVRG
ncbi:MAG: radical SAM protein [Candidatus Aureabacteria bacterium]|nr:radical SAM protein [Candidatus Auribacterota bacterium]